MNKPDILDTNFVYPEYQKHEANIARYIHDRGYSHIIRITTYVRKKYNDKWYLIPIIVDDEERYDGLSDYHKFIKDVNDRAIRKFIYDTYFVISFYIIDMNIIDDDRRPVIFEDACQLDEKERVLPGATGPILSI
jgi:hypothetical protein